MDHEHGTVGRLDLARWAVVAMIIAAGIGLFFVYGKRTQPVVEPSISEAAR